MYKVILAWAVLIGFVLTVFTLIGVWVGWQALLGLLGIVAVLLVLYWAACVLLDRHI